MLPLRIWGKLPRKKQPERLVSGEMVTRHFPSMYPRKDNHTQTSLRETRGWASALHGVVWQERTIFQKNLFQKFAFGQTQEYAFALQKMLIWENCKTLQNKKPHRTMIFSSVVQKQLTTNHHGCLGPSSPIYLFPLNSIPSAQKRKGSGGTTTEKHPNTI